tara:strand:- start:11161 stop:11955 length:795 start_codon:yes stop_codon:yes gene_type:complete
MQKRKYHDYDEYLVHQAEKSYSKDRKKRLTGGLSVVRTWIFRERFSILKQKNAFREDSYGLCLGARYGEEVEALKTHCDAIGIDLVEDLPNVVSGDFHDIPFPEGHFDFVYTNSLDHGYDLEKIFIETARVLKDNSYFCVDCCFDAYGKHESIKINNMNELILALPSNLKMIDCNGAWDTRGDIVREIIFQKVPDKTSEIQNTLITKWNDFKEIYNEFNEKICCLMQRSSLEKQIELLVETGEVTQDEIESSYNKWKKLIIREI